MAAFSGLRPVAKALGEGSSITYARGTGSPAAIASPSTVLTRYGSVSRSTGRARLIDSTILSEYQYDPHDITNATTSANTRPRYPQSVA